MKRIFGALLIFGTIAIFSGSAFAQLSQFTGRFRNADASTRGLTRIEITRDGINVRVQAWGKCSPADCDWGIQNGFAYGDGINSNSITQTRTVAVTYSRDFAETLLLIRARPGNRLEVESFTRFTDGSRRSSYNIVETFVREENQTTAREDCLNYNPNRLGIRDEGALGWLLTDGNSRMQIVDNRTDAENLLALARRHTSRCFIGRTNQRSDRYTYIVDYWKGNSGITTDVNIRNEDCISYNPNNLLIRNEGARGWLLTDGTSRMLLLDNREDALLAKQIAESNTRQCFVGRGNSRRERDRYIVDYWR